MWMMFKCHLGRSLRHESVCVYFRMVVMRNRKKIKYTEDHFNGSLEFKDEMASVYSSMTMPSLTPT